MPQQRTVTKDAPFIVARGEDKMEFFKLEESPRDGYQIRATVAPGSVLDIPPHFHLDHDEYFSIEKGEVQITMDGVAKTYDASSGDILIRRGVIHSVHAQAPSDSEIVTWEKASPADDGKELMLRVMNSLMLDSPTYPKTGNLSFSDILKINLTFYQHDAYMAPLPHWTGELGKKVDMAIDGTLATIASMIGYKPVYPEYVTQELYKSVHKDGKDV